MARQKISLRDFQENLAKRLTSAKAGESSRSLLGVQAGKEHWLLDLSESGEILPLPQLSSVPLTKRWFCGLANIRGSLYSVVDFSAFQGGETTPQNADSRLLLVGSRLGVNSALLVNRTLGLRNPDELEAHVSEPDARPWVGNQYIDPQRQTWKRLIVRNLLGQPDFLDIGLQ